MKKKMLPLNKFFSNRKLVFGASIVGLFIIALIAYVAWPFADTASDPVLQTAKVRTGDLVLTASGAGAIVPAAEVDLGFRSSGTLIELNVAVGDSVTAGEVLARLEGNIQAEADLQALFTPAGIAQAELAVVNAQDALDKAENALIYLIGYDAWYWEGQMTAEGATQEQIDYARAQRDYFLGLNVVDESALALARANLESARVALQDAQAALEIIKAGPAALNAPIAALGSRTAKLEQARLAVENTRLTAPFDGTITYLKAVVGQNVGTAPIIGLATTHDLLARFYLDETDVSSVAAGKRTLFTFDAYPDLLLEGQVLRVEPVLQVVDGTPVVVVWASLPPETETTILAGMTVNVEVIAAESYNTLLVPVQALRELGPGSYAVFVVQPDGQLKLTPVEVGLRDYANVEILSGLKAGDVVSTGNVETK